jgi:predicted transcriptional regulator
MAARKFRKTRKDPKTGVAQKYLSGSKNRAAKAAEIKETAKKYKRGENIDVKAVSRSRSQQDASKTAKRKGQGAYLSSGSRNVSMAAWAMGRVNSYMTGKGGARKADADIYKKSRGKK